MRFWYIWGEISRVMAVLCLITALAAAVSAAILLVREELMGRAAAEHSSGGGRRTGFLLLAAVTVWIFVIGQNVSAAEKNASETACRSSTSEAAQEAANGGTTAVNTETASEEEPGEGRERETEEKETEKKETEEKETEEKEEEGEEETVPDETAPLLTFHMTGEVKESGGSIYCRSDNGGFRVVARDCGESDSGITSCSISVQDSAGEVISRQWECERSGTEEVIFDPEEIAELSDGLIEVKARAQDSAGNTAAESLQFILDTEAPRLSQLLTCVGEEMTPVDRRKIYDGTDLYYGDRQLTTHLLIEDKSPVTWQISYQKQQGTDLSDRSESSAVYVSGEGAEGKAGISEEGVYSDFILTGEDAAGNTLCLAKDCICSQDTEGLVEEDGKISLPLRKILDRTPPEGEIRYTSGSTGWAYSSESGTELYFGTNVEAVLKISDRCGRQEMPVDREDYALMAAGSGRIEEVGADSYELREDGRIRLDACGRDRAGNGLRVREVFGSRITVVTGEGPLKEMSGLQPDVEKCRFQTSIIRDTVCPVLSAQISRPAGNPSAADEENAIVYYGGNGEHYDSGVPHLSVSFIISDQNLDSGRIRPCTAYLRVPDKVSCEEVEPVRDPDGTDRWKITRLSGDEGGESEEAADLQRLLLQTCRYPGREDTPDGVYRFCAEGTDMAGNPLVTGDFSENPVDKAENGSSGQSAETYGIICKDAEKGLFVTGRKVVDTEAPEGEVRIAAPDGHVYCSLKVHGREWVRESSGFMPFRRENEAVVLCRASDSSPASVFCRLLSSDGARNDAAPDGESYRWDIEEKIRIRGEQVFRVESVVLRDRAGNESAKLRETSNFYLDTKLPDADIDAPAASVRAVPEITAFSADGRPLYGGNVRLLVSAEDSDRVHGASGLGRVWYEVKADGKTVMAGQKEPGADKEETEPVYVFGESIEIPAGGCFETNDIEVIVMAQDNAGNLSDPEKGGIFRFGIDTEGPQVTVSYDNNEVRNGRYFATGRRALISVRERNFDRSALQVRVSGASAGEWKYRGNSPGGGESEWSLDLQFLTDGEYTLDIGGTDATGNPANVKYAAEAPQAFTVDRTPPLIELLWDNTDVRNGKFYNRERRATVRITDLSFDGRGARILPLPSAFRRVSQTADLRSGGLLSVYEAEIAFTEEGEWSLGCVCTDLAGNSSAPVTEEAFVIDTTSPEVYFDPDTVLEMGSYGGKIEPALCCRDENLSEESCCALWSNVTAGGKVMARAGSGLSEGYCEVFLPDPPDESSYDGICLLEGTACDLAGNRRYVRRHLCVNRFGSVYDISEDEDTEEMLSRNYADAPVPIVIAEYNVSALRSRQITIYRNGSARALGEGTDYSVTEVRNPAGVKYVYRIDPAVYREEGIYSILLESEDEAGGRSSSPGRFGKGADYSPQWTVDRTPPTVRITGVDTARHRFVADALPLRLLPSDNLELAELTVRIRDESGKIFGSQCLRGTELQNILERSGGEVPVQIEAGAGWQTLEVSARDGAGNLSTGLLGLDGREQGGYRVLVSSNLIVHLYRSGLLSAAVFLAVIAAIHHAYGVYKHTLA